MTNNNNENTKTVRVCKVSHTMDNNDNMRVTIDLSKLDFESLTAVETSDKGNRTIAYEKFVEAGVTYQVTAYVTSKDYKEYEKVEETKQMKAQAEENKRLKEEFALFQQMMQNPAFKAQYDNLKKK